MDRWKLLLSSAFNSASAQLGGAITQCWISKFGEICFFSAPRGQATRCTFKMKFDVEQRAIDVRSHIKFHRDWWRELEPPKNKNSVKFAFFAPQRIHDHRDHSLHGSANHEFIVVRQISPDQWSRVGKGAPSISKSIEFGVLAPQGRRSAHMQVKLLRNTAPFLSMIGEIGGQCCHLKCVKFCPIYCFWHSGGTDARILHGTAYYTLINVVCQMSRWYAVSGRAWATRWSWALQSTPEVQSCMRNSLPIG